MLIEFSKQIQSVLNSGNRLAKTSASLSFDFIVSVTFRKFNREKAVRRKHDNLFSFVWNKRVIIFHFCEKKPYWVALKAKITYFLVLPRNEVKNLVYCENQKWSIRTKDFTRIIIILPCDQQGYLWPSLATPPYRSSLLAGPQGYIPYPHRAAVYRFEPVALLLLGHVRGSIGEHHLWARPWFSSSDLHVWFV